jgi:hypothetical protein
MNNTRIKIPSVEKVKKTSFEGNPWYNLVGMIYLNKKYNNSCVVVPSKKFPKEHTDVSLRWIQTHNTEGYIHVPKNFWTEFFKHLRHSSNKRFIIFPFGFTCKSSGGHATYLIYDIKNKILERFDSLGDASSNCLRAKNVDIKIKKLFEDKIGINKYLKPFTKYKIFQELQDEENESLPTDPTYGFCSVWAIFWSDIRLSNPDIDRDLLIKLTLNELSRNTESLTKFIRNYSAIIVEFGKKLRTTLKSKSIKKK